MEYLVENDVDILHEEIKDSVGHLVGNDVDTLHEERIHLVGFSFIRPCLVPQKFCKIFQILRHIESLDVYMEY